MKQIIAVLMALALTACSFRGFQPPAQGYEAFKKYNTSDEVIKQDMLACGFPNVYQTSEYYIDQGRNKYTQSVLCMEKKGYRSNRHGGICEIDSFKNTEACQKHLGQ